MAILPSMLGFSNLTFLKSARIVRVLQFLRTLRLTKLAKLNKFSNTNSKQSKEIQAISVRIYVLVLGTAVFTFGTLLYFIEGGQNTLFKDIPTGVLWATQAILGGNTTNVSTFSLPAKLLFIVIQFTGLLLFGALIHLIGKFLEKKLLGSSHIVK